jgi:hypothetical protein
LQAPSALPWEEIVAVAIAVPVGVRKSVHSEILHPLNQVLSIDDAVAVEIGGAGRRRIADAVEPRAVEAGRARSIEQRVIHEDVDRPAVQHVRPADVGAIQGGAAPVNAMAPLAGSN